MLKRLTKRRAPNNQGNVPLYLVLYPYINTATIKEIIAAIRIYKIVSGDIRSSYEIR
jgi:hypothetical protein